MTEDAISLYQYINQQFPQFSKVYESLGDIYNYRLKDKLKAKLAYQTALETLPIDSSLLAAEKAYMEQYLTEEIEALK